MNNYIRWMFWGLLLFSFSCGKKNKDADAKCFPATIIVVYLGETEKRIFPLLIRTDEKDSSYLKCFGGGKDKFDKYGFSESASEYMNENIMSRDTYRVIKKYISDHNTHYNTSCTGNDPYRLKIILSDKCDFIMYSVGRENEDYFANLIATLSSDVDNRILNNLDYYKNIQSRPK